MEYHSISRDVRKQGPISESSIQYLTPEAKTDPDGKSYLTLEVHFLARTSEAVDVKSSQRSRGRNAHLNRRAAGDMTLWEDTGGVSRDGPECDLAGVDLRFGRGRGNESYCPWTMKNATLERTRNTLQSRQIREAAREEGRKTGRDFERHEEEEHHRRHKNQNVLLRVGGRQKEQAYERRAATACGDDFVSLLPRFSSNGVTSRVSIPRGLARHVYAASKHQSSAGVASIAPDVCHVPSGVSARQSPVMGLQQDHSPQPPSGRGLTGAAIGASGEGHDIMRFQMKGPRAVSTGQPKPRSYESRVVETSVRILTVRQSSKRHSVPSRTTGSHRSQLSEHLTWPLQMKAYALISPSPNPGVPHFSETLVTWTVAAAAVADAYPSGTTAEAHQPCTCYVGIQVVYIAHWAEQVGGIHLQLGIARRAVLAMVLQAIQVLVAFATELTTVGLLLLHADSARVRKAVEQLMFAYALRQVIGAIRKGRVASEWLAAVSLLAE
ncbi:hypothetical protein MRB53_040318 [Persea americana]|nr:hypothetical protein MRB53_040318 [Persea americana]